MKIDSDPKVVAVSGKTIPPININFICSVGYNLENEYRICSYVYMSDSMKVVNYIAPINREQLYHACTVYLVQEPLFLILSSLCYNNHYYDIVHMHMHHAMGALYLWSKT